MPYATTNPATGKTEKEFESLSEEAVDQAVDSAHDAYLQWHEIPIEDRTAVVGKVGELMLERKEELAQLITLEMGKLIEEARGEVDLAASIFTYYAENGPLQIQDQELEVDEGEARIVIRSIGVLIGVMPWNFPYYQVARFAAPNVVVGNTILLKHAGINPQCAQAIEDLFRDAGAPPGVYTNLFADSEMIERIIENPKIAGASLTGSEKAGQSIAEIAGRNLKKVVLELGGSDPFVVLDGDNLERTIEAAVMGRMANTGQSCVASKRFIVLEDVYDDFVAGFAQALSGLEAGDPADETTTLGPLSSADALDALEEQVNDAVENGAKAVTGGHRINRGGNYFEATLLTGVTPDAKAFKEELFGPVAVVYKVADEDEAVELANNSPYGLGGTVIGSDVKHAQEVGDRIETGMVWINHPTWTQADLPFGGIKRSGMGRELAGLGINEFVNKKLIRSLPADAEILAAGG